LCRRRHKHDLRHTCASLLIAAEAHPKAIQEHLGHKDIQTTFNVYGHLLPSAQKALAAALDTVFDGEQTNNVRSLPKRRQATSK
jgi:integrase